MLTRLLLPVSRVALTLVLVSAGLIVSLLDALPAYAAERAIRPNFVFVLVDDLGWTDLACMGGDLYETPNIDRLARQGMRFTNAYSACTVCSPTRAAVLTGKYPARLHITDWIHGHKLPKAKLRVPNWTEYLPLEEETLAEALAPLGYASASIGKWHLGDDDAYFPDHQGFDLNIAGYGKGQPPHYFSPYNIPTLSDGRAGEYLTDRLTDEACKFINEHAEQPFFVYLPHYAVHTPLEAKQPAVEHFRKKVSAELHHTNAVYAAMIQSVDESVGRVMDTLATAGIAERTIIVFTSDNGGLMQSTSNVPLRVGKGSAYEGGVRVPLIVKWPGTTPPGSVSAEPVISVDFFPTMLQMAGALRTPSPAIDGVSLVPVLSGKVDRLARDAIFWHYPHYHPGGATPYGAIRAGDWTLIEFFEDMHLELYNIADDIGEQQELSRARPEKARQLRDQLHAWRSAVGAQMPTPNPDYDPAAATFPARRGPRKASR
ncbi:MAG TPA: sulfatase [Pirellulales bacterium]|jgi:arylsulfatase A-like enzyme|nr:sulfatase [Pirellulales bacterium]